jgi:hypothetical protein
MEGTVDRLRLHLIALWLFLAGVLGACASGGGPVNQEPRQFDVVKACNYLQVTAASITARREAGQVPDSRWRTYEPALANVARICADPAATDPAVARSQLVAAGLILGVSVIP